MNPSRKRTVILLSTAIMMLLAILSCTIFDDYETLKPSSADYTQEMFVGQTYDANATQTKAAWTTQKADSTRTRNAAFTSTMEAKATEVVIRQLETEGAAEVETMIALATWEAENLIYGVEPQKVICEGDYTLTMTRLTEPVKSCSFTVPFTLEMYNVGALGGDEFSEATFYWSYVDFQWPDCSVEKMTDTLSTGTFSGGPNGHTDVAWANIQLYTGQTGSVTFTDEDESVSGRCAINNPSVFSGWTGP